MGSDIAEECLAFDIHNVFYKAVFLYIFQSFFFCKLVCVSILFYSILFYSILFYYILLYSRVCVRICIIIIYVFSYT